MSYPKPLTDAMRVPITTEAQAKAFIHMLQDNGQDFHFDDPPTEVYHFGLGLNDPPKLFTHEDALLVEQQVDKLFELMTIDPFEYAMNLRHQGRPQETT